MEFFQRKEFLSRTLEYPQQENKLSAFIEDKREYISTVSTDMCRTEVTDVGLELNVNVNEFKANRGLLPRILERNVLSVQQKTIISCK